MNNELGKRIKSLREESELSQLELAKILNISNSTLSQYEAGNRIPGDDIKNKIADYFNVSVDFLLGRTDDPTPYTQAMGRVNRIKIENFSDRLKQLRNEKGVLQRELADYLNVSRVTITQYENGSRSPDDETKKKIAEYFNVSLDYLMGFSDIRNPYKEISIEEEYKREIEALDEFRQIMIDKGFDYEDKTYEELAEIIVKHIKIQELLNDNNSKSN